jgi:hypothetical protein
VERVVYLLAATAFGAHLRCCTYLLVTASSTVALPVRVSVAPVYELRRPRLCSLYVSGFTVIAVDSRDRIKFIDSSNRKPREGEAPEVLKARSQHGQHRLNVAGTSKTNRSDAVAQQTFQGKRTAVLGSL